MKWILLPGFDGTGILFAPLLRVLPPEIEPVVVAYPVDRTCSADGLVEIVQRRYPGTHLERIESPHLILQVQPEASIRAILQFLAWTRPGA